VFRFALLTGKAPGNKMAYNIAIQEVAHMKRFVVAVSVAAAFIFSAKLGFSQAFGEYGRTLGGIPHGQGITGSRAPGRVTEEGTGSGSVGDVGGRALPSRLVVARKDAGLYPRQDDESERLAQLAQGEPIIPMVQSAGGNEWYMVKTQTGLVGWVRATDVREEKVKK
jgi:hypothetical protein